MKKIVGWILSWSMFLLGDLVSKMMNTRVTYWMFSIYCWLMVKSSNIQDWSQIDNGPWG